MNGERQFGWMWLEACQVLERADRLQRQFLRYLGPGSGVAVWEPPVDVMEGPEGLVLVFALPGVAPEDIEVRLEPGALTVSANRRLQLNHPDTRIRRLEIPHGRFIRRVPLAGVPLGILATRYERGCLQVHLGRAAER